MAGSTFKRAASPYFLFFRPVNAEGVEHQVAHQSLA